MDINGLKSFLAVARTGSFSRAAELLFITQPAVSKRIANLEDSLKTQLFDRIGHRVSLTAAGKILEPKAQAIIVEMENCIQDIRNLDDSVSGVLRLGLSHYIGLERIPNMLNQFSETYPDVELDINFYDSETAKEDILQGVIDVAVVTLPSTLQKSSQKLGKKDKESDLQEQLIWNDELEFVAHKKHPLIQSSQVSLEDLRDYPAILPSLNTFTGQLVYEHFDANKIKLRARHPTNNLENIKVMISTGFMPNCWGVLPNSMVKDSSIRVLNLKGNHELVRRLGCLTATQRTLSNAALTFIQTLIQYGDA